MRDPPCRIVLVAALSSALATAPAYGQETAGTWFGELARARQAAQRAQARVATKPVPPRPASTAAPVAEVEPNNTAATANPVTLGEQAAGTITPAGDVDFWSFPAGAGTQLDISVTASRSGSPLDPTLVLVAPDRTTVLAFNNDYYGLDSRITFTIQTTGTYYVAIRDFAGSGGPGHFYTINFDTFTCAVTGTEEEPNDTPATARTAMLGQSHDGLICPDGDVDYWSFAGAAGQIIELEVAAYRLGSPLDPTLELFASDGTTSLAFNDDSDGLDSRIEYTVPVTGTYYAAVRGFGGRGGPSHTYTIHFRALEPGPGDPVTTRATGLGFPIGLAASPNGELLVGDPFGDRIWRVGPQGGAAVFATGVPAPLGIAVDAFGAVLAVSADRTVYRVSSQGLASAYISSLGTPFWVAVGPDGAIWVTDPGPARLIRFSPVGQPVASFDVSGAGGFGPGPIAIAPTGEPYFSTGPEIWRLTPAGQPERVLAGTGVMWAFAFDLQGNLYVPNPERGRVMLYGPTGALLADPLALTPTYPLAVAFGREASGATNARLFITDAEEGSLVELNPAGVLAAGHPVGVTITFGIAAAASELLLGDGSLTPAEREFLDAMGNRNGRYDVGDFRAYVLSVVSAGVSAAALLRR